MLIRQSLAYLPAQVLGPLFQLVSIVAWTHLASEGVIGVVTFVTVTQDLLVQVGLSWWTLYLLRCHHEYERSGRLAALTGSSLVVVGASVALQAAAALTNLFVAVDPHPSLAFCVAVLGFVALRGINAYNITLATIHVRPLDFAVFSLLGPVGGFGIGLALLLTLGVSPLWPILGYAVGEGLAVLWGLARLQAMQVSFAQTRQIISEGTRYGGPLAIAAALGWLVLNIPRYAVDATMGIEEVGRYAVGFGLGQRASAMAAMAVTIAAYPLAVKQGEQHGRSAAMTQLRNNVALLVGVMAPSLLGLWLVSPALVELAVGRQYWRSTLELLPWSLLSGAVSALAIHFLNHVLLLDRRTWALSGVEFVTAVLTLILVFPAMKLAGSQGAVISIVAARGLTATGLAVWLVARHNLELPIRELVVIAGASLAMAAALAMTPAPAEVGWLIARIALGAGVYALFIALAHRTWLWSQWRTFLASR